MLLFLIVKMAKSSTIADLKHEPTTLAINELKKILGVESNPSIDDLKVLAKTKLRRDYNIVPTAANNAFPWDQSIMLSKDQLLGEIKEKKSSLKLTTALDYTSEPANRLLSESKAKIESLEAIVQHLDSTGATSLDAIKDKAVKKTIQNLKLHSQSVDSKSGIQSKKEELIEFSKLLNTYNKIEKGIKHKSPLEIALARIESPEAPNVKEAIALQLDAAINKFKKEPIQVTEAELTTRLNYIKSLESVADNIKKLKYDRMYYRKALIKAIEAAPRLPDGVTNESLKSATTRTLEEIATNMGNKKVNALKDKAFNDKTVFLSKIEEITNSAKLNFLTKEITATKEFKPLWKTSTIDKKDASQIITFLKEMTDDLKNKANSILELSKRFENTFIDIKQHTLYNLDGHGESVLLALEKGAKINASEIRTRNVPPFTRPLGQPAALPILPLEQPFTRPLGQPGTSMRALPLGQPLVQPAEQPRQPLGHPRTAIRTEPIPVGQRLNTNTRQPTPTAIREPTSLKTPNISIGKLALYAIGAVAIGTGLYYGNNWLTKHTNYATQPTTYKATLNK